MNQVRLFQRDGMWVMECPHPHDHPELRQEAIIANQPDVVAVYVEQGKLTLCLKTNEGWTTIRADVGKVQCDHGTSQVAMLGGPYPKA